MKLNQNFLRKIMSTSIPREKKINKQNPIKDYNTAHGNMLAVKTGYL